MRELLPTHYFLVTFTVPGALRRCVRSNQRTCYAALFDATSATLVEMASKKKFVGTDRMGFFGVLHTWGRDFTTYNPHVPVACYALCGSRRRCLRRWQQVDG